jgi:hypothetical protein
MNPEKSVTWLITCGTLFHPGTPDEKRFIHTELMDGPADIQLAEALAFKLEVPEALEQEPEGQWITMDGLRAFEYNDNHSELEVGAIFWIDYMRIVEPADVAVMKKYLAFPPSEVRTQRRCEQLRLRGLQTD